MAAALLTGITGFVGAHLARALVDDGVEVHAVVRPHARLDRVPDLVPRVHLHVDDGGDAALPEAVATAAPEVVYHLATRFLGAHRPSDVTPLLQDNVVFPTRLLEALVPARPAVVSVGTAWQHVDGANYRPRNLYAATKQAFEDVLAHYARNEGIAAVTVNLFDTYGPADQRGKLVATLVSAALQKRRLEMSSGRQLIDLVEVSDVVEALRDAAAHTSAGSVPVYAAGSGSPRSLREVVEVLDSLLPEPVPVRWGVRPDRADEMLVAWDAGPAVPGWRPMVTLEQGLARLLAETGSASR